VDQNDGGSDVGASGELVGLSKKPDGNGGGGGKPGSGPETITWVTLHYGTGTWDNKITEFSGTLEGGLVLGDGPTFALDQTQFSGFKPGPATSNSCLAKDVKIGIVEVLKKGKKLTTVIVRGYYGGNTADSGNLSSDRLTIPSQEVPKVDGDIVNFGLPVIPLYEGNGGSNGSGEICTVALDTASYDFDISVP